MPMARLHSVAVSPGTDPVAAAHAPALVPARRAWQWLKRRLRRVDRESYLCYLLFLLVRLSTTLLLLNSLLLF